MPEQILLRYNSGPYGIFLLCDVSVCFFRAELPGFYYDGERNRYFPVSFRGPQKQRKTDVKEENVLHCKGGHITSSNVQSKVLQILQNREIGTSSSLWSSSPPYASKQEYLETQASNPWVWSYGATLGSADGAVEEFHATLQTNEGIRGMDLVTWGNGNGVVGLAEVVQSNSVCDETIFPEPERIVPPAYRRRCSDMAHPPLVISHGMTTISSSKVTTIRKPKNSVDADRGNVILTTLGSGWEGGAIYHLTQRLVPDGASQTSGTLAFDTAKCVVTDSSIWSATYCAAGKATLGTSRGAALVDLERSALRWLVHSKSDVLSQECDLGGHLLFCGFRNGYISMVDMRSSQNRPRRMPLIQTRPETSSASKSLSFWKRKPNHARSMLKNLPHRDKAAEIAQNFCETMRMKSAVCSLVLLRSDETYLLASAMNGDVNLWDRRLFEKGPVLTYEGNRNTHSLLRLGVDVSESLLMSGGEDSAIRIWSLRSGKLLQTISGLPALVHCFSSPTRRQELPMNSSHTWGMWMGSSASLMYMHGSALSSV